MHKNAGAKPGFRGKKVHMFKGDVCVCVCGRGGGGVPFADFISFFLNIP